MLQDMEELLQIRRTQHEAERSALDAEVAQSKENFNARVEAAQRDPELNVEAQHESQNK